MKNYISPELSIAMFDDCDIVTTSAGSDIYDVPIDTINSNNNYGQIYNIDFTQLEPVAKMGD